MLVSACLAGIPCRYDGRARTIPEIVALVREGRAVPVCPEVLGGLSTPRPPAEIRDLGDGGDGGDGTGGGGGGNGTGGLNGGGDDAIDATDPGSLVLADAARVETEQGVNVTEAYRKGAAEALRIARQAGVRLAIFKEKSPSCGVHAVYDGSFRSRLRPGSGVATALLRQNGIKVVNEDEFRANLLVGWYADGGHPDTARPGAARGTDAGRVDK